MNAFGGDVRAVVEALALRKVVLVGHSMGGHVIVEASQLMPDRVAALVLVETFGNVDQRQSAEDLERFLAPMRADFRGTTEAWVRRRLFAGRSDRSWSNGSPTTWRPRRPQLESRPWSTSAATTRALPLRRWGCLYA